MAQQLPDQEGEELVLERQLELARGSRRRGVLFGAPFIRGRERLCETLLIEWLGELGCCELNRSQFVRLSQELEECFLDLRGPQVQRLRDLCLLANSSEEFFLSVSKEQWVRTVIICNKDLFFTEVIDLPKVISSITIHSIVVPCDPYWSKLQAVRDEAAREVASKRLYFPSTFLEVALSNQKSLVDSLNDWPEREQQCAIRNQFHEFERDTDEEMRTSSRPFWEITPNDVQEKRIIYVNDCFVPPKIVIEEVWWRGGIFIRKNFDNVNTFETELEVVRRVSHPHVVYSFGLSSSADEKQHSILMESLDRDLQLLIIDRVRVNGSSEPPFSRQESIDILVQIAKAVTYMHGLAEPVIHGDLKPKNILVSQCEILGDVCQYLVKVADFGSAQILNSSVFLAKGRGTTEYAAPELLEKPLFPVEIGYPKKIDVYSFGIIAFQVLTGLEPYEKFPSLLVARRGVIGLVPYEGASSRSDMKRGVIAGNLRPPLREACCRPNFWNDPDLIALVESCWHPDPSTRPEFSEVTNRLESIYNILNQNPRIRAHAFAPPEVNEINDAPQNPRIGAHAFAPPEVNEINDAPQNSQNSQNGAHVLPPAQEYAVNDGLQNQNIETHASPRPEANAIATTVDGALQVSGHMKPKKSFRKRGFLFAKMLSCVHISPRNVME